MANTLRYCTLIFLLCGGVWGVNAQKALENRWTGAHVEFPNSGLFVVLPQQDFEPVPNASAYRQPALEAVLGYFQVMMTPEAFVKQQLEETAKQSGTVLLREEYTLEGNPATLLKMIRKSGNDPRPMIMWGLISKTPDKSFFIMGGYPIDQDKALGDKYHTCLLTLCRPDPDYVLLGALGFSVDFRKSKLFPSKSAPAGTFVLTLGGAYPPFGADLTMLMGNKALGVSAEMQQQESLMNMFEFPNDGPKTVFRDYGVDTLYADGLKGFAVHCIRKTPIGEVLEYRAVYYDVQDCYWFDGNSNIDFDKNLSAFQQLVRSFRKRE